ncbi:MAG: hypothetical protein GHHEDOFH_02889 [Pseudorhodoplanes sp.]|nr:hypothetical protein [Pseudorhodoplanes sp.]
MATSAITSAERVICSARPPATRREARRPSSARADAIVSDGRRPVRRPTTTAVPSVNAMTNGDVSVSARRGRSAGASASNTCEPTDTRPTAATPPRRASSVLSTRPCCSSRPRVAPSAERTEASWCLAVARASSTLAMLTHISSNRTPTPTVSKTSAGRSEPTTCSASGTTVTSKPSLVSGYCCALRAAMAPRSARPSATVRPGASRPMTASM